VQLQYSWKQVSRMQRRNRFAFTLK